MTLTTRLVSIQIYYSIFLISELFVILVSLNFNLINKKIQGRIHNLYTCCKEKMFIGGGGDEEALSCSSSNTHTHTHTQTHTHACTDTLKLTMQTSLIVYEIGHNT